MTEPILPGACAPSSVDDSADAAGAVTRVLALRHGETDWNRGARIQGHTDIALNDTGRWQATRLAQALADEPLAAIYSSDLQRAHHTARALSALTGVPVTLDAGLRERGFGRYEGRTFTEVEAEDPVAARRWRQRDPAFEPPGGESLTAFSARVVATARRLCAAHPGAQVALVAHGGVLDCLYRAATGTPIEAPRAWPIPNAAVNRLLLTAEGLSLVAWGDERHLEGAAARDELGPVA